MVPGNLPGLLSLACSNETNTVAAGTEFANHQASIIIWLAPRLTYQTYVPQPSKTKLTTPRDLRSPTAPKTQYNEGHSDDITEVSRIPPPQIPILNPPKPTNQPKHQLTYYPTTPSHLLSGSTDGLLNLTDTSITDEDDAVLATINHGSVHRAGFLSDTSEVYAASHDEKFALYDLADNGEGSEGGGAPLLDLGDVRAALGCRYLAGVVPKHGGMGAVVGVGAQEYVFFPFFFFFPSFLCWGL